MKKLLAIALCALFSIHAAEARTIYVNAKRPNNKGDGFKVKTAKKTIQAAINIAKKGDTILVYPGTYAPIKTNNKKISIKSVKGQKKTKLVPKSWRDNLAVLSKNDSGNATALVGFTLEGKGFQGLSWDSGDAVIGGSLTSCILQKFEAGSSIIRKSKLSECVVRDNYLATCNLFESCMVVRSKITANKYVAVDYPQSWTALDRGSSFINCLIVANSSLSDFFDSTTLQNCTIANNRFYNKCYGSYSDGLKFENCELTNCILWNNYSQGTWTEWKEVAKNGAHDEWGYYDKNGTWVHDEREEDEGYYDDNSVWISYDYQSRTVVGPYTTEEKIVHSAPAILHNSDPGNTYKNTDKTNRNPKFTSAYKLKKGSYAINKGKLTKAQKKLVGKTDLAGKKRIKGKAIDCGCYEY